MDSEDILYIKNATLILEGPLLLLSVVNSPKAIQLGSQIRTNMDELSELFDVKSYLAATGRTGLEISIDMQKRTMNEPQVAAHIAKTYPNGPDEFIRAFEAALFNVTWAKQGAKAQAYELLEQIIDLLEQALISYRFGGL